MASVTLLPSPFVVVPNMMLLNFDFLQIQSIQCLSTIAINVRRIAFPVLFNVFQDRNAALGYALVSVKSSQLLQFVNDVASVQPILTSDTVTCAHFVSVSIVFHPVLRTRGLNLSSSIARSLKSFQTLQSNSIVLLNILNETLIIVIHKAKNDVGDWIAEPFMTNFETKFEVSNAEIDIIGTTQNLHCTTKLPFCTAYFDQLESFLSNRFSNPNKLISHGLVLFGIPGCGKTTILRVLSAKFKQEIKVHETSGMKIISSRTVPTELENWINLCKEQIDCDDLRQNTIFLIDDLHAFCQDETSLEESKRFQTESGLLEMIHGLRESPYQKLIDLLDMIRDFCLPACVIATASNIATLSKELCTSSRLDRKIEITPPSLTDRRICLQSLLCLAFDLETDNSQTEDGLLIHNAVDEQSCLDFASTSDSSLDLTIHEAIANIASFMANRTVGYNFRDLVRLVRRVVIFAKQNSQTQTTQNSNTCPVSYSQISANKPYIQLDSQFCSKLHEICEQALCFVRPSQLHDLHAYLPRERWSDVGGYNQIKQILIETVIWQFDPQRLGAMHRLQLPVVRGILFSGPSGCGKSLLVKSLAGECGINLIEVKSSTIFSKYLGDTEATIRTLFSRSRAASPCILFFDELDVVGKKRESDGSDSLNERVVATLLNEMDGISSVSGDLHAFIFLLILEFGDIIKHEFQMISFIK